MASPPARPIYRAFLVDPNGHIHVAHVLDCATDEQAMTAAEQYIDGHCVELWDRSRKITAFPPWKPTVNRPGQRE
jgi:hypothetical protein